VNELTKPESLTLIQCERVIEQGKQTFIEVGTALCRIRDERLYRAEFGSFNEYCEARWGWSDNYARRLISAANIAQSVPIGTVSTASQARELANVEPAKRAEVLEKAGEKPTARAIRQAARVTAAQASAPVAPYSPPSADPEWQAEPEAETTKDLIYNLELVAADVEVILGKIRGAEFDPAAMREAALEFRVAAKKLEMTAREIEVKAVVTQ